MSIRKPFHPRWPVLCVLVGLALTLGPAAAHAAKEPKKRVAVTSFENRAKASAYKVGHLGDAMAEKLIDALIDTDKFVVLERLALTDVLNEQNLDQLAPISPEVEARLTSAQALIRGVITDIEVVGGGKGGIGLGKIRVGGNKQTVVVKVNIRIIDTVTGQIIESETVEGIAKMRGASFVSRTKNLDADLEGEDNIPIGEAADEAVAQAVDGIIAGMERVPWQGNIAKVSGRQIFVNAGYQENVEPGLVLKVFERGAPLIDPETNEHLGSLDEEIGVIEIERVDGRWSIAKILQGQGFARGNIVRPVSDLQ